MTQSREYLEELLAEAKKHLPGWVYMGLMKAARARSGGRSSHRVDTPSTIEKLALTEIRPAKLRDIEDEELSTIWLRLHQWYTSAKRQREAVENIVNAALWVKQELESRGKSVSASPLVVAVAELAAVKKARGESVSGKRGPMPEFIEQRLDKAPDEILLVRDFISVAGSAAVAEKPGDIDVVIRAEYNGPTGSYLLDGAGMWVALRRFLTPDKGGPQLQLIASPTGSFTDYIPCYDLVARRRQPNVQKIESTPPEYEGKERVIKALSEEQQAEYDAETAKIKANSEKPEAKKAHEFKAAEWTFPNGHPRCLICGSEKTVSGYCNSPDKDEKAITIEKTLQGLIPSPITKHQYDHITIIKERDPVQVPAVGSDNAAIAFVGASPGKIEAARRESFTGPVGETFNEVYLKPLGLKRSQVLLLNAVPQHLTDDEGRTREPVAEEIEEWRPWIEKLLDTKTPRIIVALGKSAESALGDKSDYILPHPSAVRRFGNSGEVGRKLRRIRAQLKTDGEIVKQLSSPLLQAEGGTRSTQAADNWEKNWAKLLPRSGRGKFAYQHHWRGLNEDELGMSDANLMTETDHSIHGDLRLQGEDGLWGFTVFLGKTEDNRKLANLDKLIDFKEGDGIEASPKLGQPEEWLDVGAEKPFVSGPGEVGATANKHSKFFRQDSGTYQLGVARQHAVEIFLDGSHLKGRYLLILAPVAGQRRWLIEKPEDQTPIAETRDLADVISELKTKKQRHLVWSAPGEKPRFIDVRTGRVEKGGPISISKADPVKRIVYGVVLDPYGENGPKEDAHNDWNPPGEIEKTAHEFVKRSRVIGLQHSKKANAEMVESWVEPYPTRADYLNAMAGLPHKVYRRPFGNDVLHSGSWVMGVELGKEEWEMFEAKELNAFSPGGVGARRSIARGEMPKVQFIDIEEKEPRA